MKIAITGGGTGGHLNIAKCLLQSAKKRGIECIYIGSENGQDKTWFENEDKFEAKYFLPSSGVVNKKGISKFKSLSNILNLSFHCKKILKNHQIQAVFSVGGYSSAPAAFGAIFSRIPLFIHEQNAKKGSLNSLLKPFCKGFFSAFEDTFCPYPVDKKFFHNARIRTKLESIIFLGGSQGAKFINELALKLAPILHQKGIKIIHQCGQNDFDLCEQTYKELGINAEIFAFDKNLELRMHKADLAISRAGASTLFELCANTLPTLFIPFPYAAKNHQYFNAKFLQDKALCQIFIQEFAKDEEILKAIFAMNLEDISTRLKGIIAPNGADFMLQKALNLQ